MSSDGNVFIPSEKDPVGNWSVEGGITLHNQFIYSSSRYIAIELGFSCKCWIWLSFRWQYKIKGSSTYNMFLRSLFIIIKGFKADAAISLVGYLNFVCEESPFLLGALKQEKSKSVYFHDSLIFSHNLISQR